MCVAAYPGLTLQSQLEQLAEATTKINGLIAKLEQSKQQLDRANKEIKDLKEAAQVCRCWADLVWGPATRDMGQTSQASTPGRLELRAHLVALPRLHLDACRLPGAPAQAVWCGCPEQCELHAGIVRAAPAGL